MQLAVAEVAEKVQAMHGAQLAGQVFRCADQHQFRYIRGLLACGLPGSDEPGNVLARLAGAHRQPVALGQLQVADVGGFALETGNQVGQHPDLVPGLGKELHQFVGGVLRRCPDAVRLLHRVADGELVGEAIDPLLEPRAMAVGQGQLEQVMQLQYIAQVLRFPAQGQAHVEVADVQLHLGLTQGLGQKTALEAQPVRQAMHPLQWCAPPGAMHPAAQRMVFRGDAEQLQADLRIGAQGVFQCQVLPADTTVAVARGGAVIQTYAHTDTSSLSEGSW